MKRTLAILVGALLAAGCSGSSGGSSGSTSTGTTGASTTGATSATGAGSTSGTSTAGTTSSGSTSGGSTTGTTGTTGTTSGSGSTSGTGSTTGATTGSTTGGAPAPITGTTFVQYVSAVDGGVTEVPWDNSVQADTVALLALDDAGYQTVVGDRVDDGGYYETSVSVPSPYYAVAFGDFVYETGHQVDFDYALAGRPDVSYGGGLLQLDVSGSDPISKLDYVELSALNVDTMEFAAAQDAVWPDGGSAFTPGETAIQGQLDWTNYPTIDPAEGDQLFLAHLPQTDAGASGAAFTMKITAFADLSGLAVGTDGGTTTATATMTAPLQTMPVSGTLDEGASFAAELPAGFSFDSAFYDLGTLPDFSSQGIYTNNFPDLFLAQSFSESAMPLQFTAAVANPYPAWWTPFVRAEVSWTRGLAISPSTGGTYNAGAGWGYIDVLPTPATLSPEVGLPRNLQVNGQPTTTDLAGVGASPVLSWDAPSFGTPQWYTGLVRSLTYDATNQQVKTHTAAYFVVPASVHQFTVPAGQLTAGQTYYVQLFAISQTSGDRLAQPYHQPANERWSWTSSRLLQP